MPVKSRTLLDELCDPQLAYWPHDTYAWSVRPRPKRQLYHRLLNNLMDEILDTPKEIEMEVERSDCKEQPMELDKAEAKCPSANEMTDEKLVEDGKTVNEAVAVLKPTELSLRLSQYKPEDIKVIVKDNRLTIKGNLEKKSANSYCSQSFERTFALPKDADQQSILCSMDAKNGLIKLNIPRKKLEPIDEVKEIKINHESSEEQKEADSSSAKLTVDEPIVEDIIEE